MRSRRRSTLVSAMVALRSSISDRRQRVQRGRDRCVRRRSTTTVDAGRRRRARTRRRSSSASRTDRCCRSCCRTRRRGDRDPDPHRHDQPGHRRGGRVPRADRPRPQVAVEFINTELDGVDGHPIELVDLQHQLQPRPLAELRAGDGLADRSPRSSAASTSGAPASRRSQNNGIPYVGGIPVSFDAARSPVSFQFSGGTWGAVLGDGAVRGRGARRPQDRDDLRRVRADHRLGRARQGTRWSGTAPRSRS